MAHPELSYTHLLQKSWPIILANSAVPLLGLCDTFIIGNYGDVAEIGAIALGATVFSIIYWSFGFLRMTTSGFIAQAAGANNQIEIRANLARSLITALAIGSILIVFQLPINILITLGLSASKEVESITSNYFLIRIWGAPATLAMFVAIGVLIGLGKSYLLLIIQFFLNLLNILLDILFSAVLDWGVEGIAIGTVISEWCALLFSAKIIYSLLQNNRGTTEAFWPLPHIFNKEKLKRIFSANIDVFIRTFLLVLSFFWFNNQSAKFSDEILAANFILLQLISFSAFFLDGYAFVAEALIGKSIGLKDKVLFILTVKKTSVLALISAVTLSVIVYLLGGQLIAFLTDIETVRDLANSALLFASLYILLSCAAFQLDGIFIGATASREMRNASVISFGILMLTWWLLKNNFNNELLWITFTIFLIARAGTLLYYFPRLLSLFR